MFVDEKWLNNNTGKYTCPYCDKDYTKKKGISTHILRTHIKDERFKNVGTTGMSWTLGENYKSPRKLKKEEILAKRVITPCEKCGNVPNVWFGSGRFCSLKCSNSNVKTDETKKKISEKLSGRVIKLFTDIYFCKYCNKCKKENNGRIFCDKTCQRLYSIKNYNDLELYRYYTKFDFSLNDYPEEFDFSLIENMGGIKPK